MNSKTLASSVVNTLLLTFFGVALPVITALGQPVLTSMSPVYGSAGTEVMLPGSGLMTAESLAVSMGGTPAPILGRTAGQVRFVVPPAAATGPVQVTIGDGTYTYPTAFTVTRPIRAQIAPEAGIAVTKYSVGSLYGDAPGTGPNYDLQVAKGESTLVAASAGDLDPVLMAIVTDELSGIVLSAETTALALLYFVPGFTNACKRDRWTGYTSRQCWGCLNGIHFSGPGVAFNRIVGFEVRSVAKAEFAGNRNFGVAFDNGAVMNELTVFSISSNRSGGIRITGAATFPTRKQELAAD